jgi:hypothetical protein
MAYSEKTSKYNSIKGVIYTSNKIQALMHSMREKSNTYFQIIAESWIPFGHSVRLDSNTERLVRWVFNCEIEIYKNNWDRNIKVTYLNASTSLFKPSPELGTYPVTK